MGERTGIHDLIFSRHPTVSQAGGATPGLLTEVSIESCGGATSDLAIGGFDAEEARQTAQPIERIGEVTPSKANLFSQRPRFLENSA